MSWLKSVKAFWARVHSMLIAIPKRPWAGVLVGMGVILGLALRLPLFPPPLSEANANLIGAALGAAIAVWGAQWLVSQRQNSERALAQVSIRQVLEPWKDTLQKAINTAKDFQPPPDTSLFQAKSKPVQSAGAQLHRELTVFDSRIAHMRELFNALGPAGVMAYGDLARISEATRTTAAKILNLVNSSPGTIPNEIDKLLTDLKVHRKELYEAVHDLGIGLF